MKTITLLHPFSAQAIGLKESDLYYYHSKPHENALRSIQNHGFKVTIAYFTGKWFPYKKQVSEITKIFWTVTKPIFKNRHVWRKQQSLFYLLANQFIPPDLTIINMSGHASNYVFKLANILLKKNKVYIAMVGGIHMSTTSKALQYYKRAHHIIVHTQIQKNNLKQIEGFKELTIKVIPLGIETQLFKPLLTKTNQKKLLYVGRISRLKQIEKTIEAVCFLVNSNTNAYLNIIGPISDQVYFSELKALVVTYKLQDKVKFMGSLKQQELIPFYQQASLLLLPSKHESFGMVITESMSCGTPVIALKGSGGPDEIIVNNVNGYLCTPQSFNQKVFEFINSDQKLLELNTNSRKLVEEKWSIEYTTECLLDSINSVFSSN